MSMKALAWTLLAAMALTGVLLLNYWAAYQPLSTLVYSGIVMAFAGLANVVVPFRFLGIRKRASGALMLAGGAGLAFAALSWPASTIRVAQPRTQLDQIMPEYQFSERHSVIIHARPEQVMQAVRQATFGDMKSLFTLLKIRATVLRAPFPMSRELQEKRILDSFSESGFLTAGSARAITMFQAVDVRATRRAEVRTAQEFTDYRAQGAVKMAFDFNVEEAGKGWSTIRAETRLLALDETRRGMGRYWRIIVPGSGLLRLQWLEGIKKRAESMPDARPST